MIRIGFSPAPSALASAKLAAVNGLRNAYMQKYVPNAAITAHTAQNASLR
jgi:hypothetical protein